MRKICSFHTEFIVLISSMSIDIYNISDYILDYINKIFSSSLDFARW